MRYRYLLGAMQQIQATMTVRQLAEPSEIDRLPEIIERWRAASRRMQQLAQVEAGAADQTRSEEPPDEIRTRITEIESDPLFRASFSLVPTTVKLVDIDSLVAPQREVNLDYVALLGGRLSGEALADLVEFCLTAGGGPPPVQALQTDQNRVTFSSRSLDLRFLGGYPKPLTEEDVRAAHLGGQPVEVVVLLVGFGAAPINAWAAGSRLVLNNGFHRITALRSRGVMRVPLVVQHAANPQIEFPEQLLGLSRAYLLQHPRPVLVRDFFDDDLVLDLQLKPRMKTVRLAWEAEHGVVPTE